MNGDYFTDCRRYHDYESRDPVPNPETLPNRNSLQTEMCTATKGRGNICVPPFSFPFHLSLFFPLSYFSSPFLSHPTPRYLHTLSFIVRSDKYRCIPVLPIKCMAMIGIIALFSAWPDEMQNFLKAFQPGKIQSVLQNLGSRLRQNTICFRHCRMTFAPFSGNNLFSA